MRFWPRRRAFLPVALPKKSPSAYHSLLLRTKKRPQIKPLATTTRHRFPLSFWWQKYRGALAGTILGIGIFALVLGVFLLTGFFAVREVALTRSDLRVNVPAVARALVPLKGKNIFSFSAAAVETELKQKFPEIASVQMNRDFPGTLRVTVGTFPIAAQWEFHSSNSKTKSEEEATLAKVFVNRNGQVSLNDPSVTEPVFLLIETVEKTPENLNPGATLYPADKLQQILEAKDLLATIIPFTLSAAEIFRDAQEVHFYTAEGPEFWFDFFTPLPEQITKIETALQERNIFEEAVQYFDLRIPGKIIYQPQA